VPPSAPCKGRCVFGTAPGSWTNAKRQECEPAPPAPLHPRAEWMVLGSDPVRRSQRLAASSARSAPRAPTAPAASVARLAQSGAGKSNKPKRSSPTGQGSCSALQTNPAHAELVEASSFPIAKQRQARKNKNSRRPVAPFGPTSSGRAGAGEAGNLIRDCPYLNSVRLIDQFQQPPLQHRKHAGQFVPAFEHLAAFAQHVHIPCLLRSAGRFSMRASGRSAVRRKALKLAASLPKSIA
jgi:hypothetical protein